MVEAWQQGHAQCKSLRHNFFGNDAAGIGVTELKLQLPVNLRPEFARTQLEQTNADDLLTAVYQALASPLSDAAQIRDGCL